MVYHDFEFLFSQVIFIIRFSSKKVTALLFVLKEYYRLFPSDNNRNSLSH